MPRVSEEYLEKRRQQICEAAERCFMKKGLQATMQEICSEAGLSAGAVYNLFPSKDDIIARMVASSKEWNRFEPPPPATPRGTVGDLFEILLRPQRRS